MRSSGSGPPGQVAASVAFPGDAPALLVAEGASIGCCAQ